MFTWTPKNKTEQIIVFPPLMTLYSSQPRVVLLSVAVSCLQLKCRDCHKNPHICCQSPVAFSQLFSVLSSIYKVKSMRGCPWINIALAINSRSCTILFLPIKHKLCTELSPSFRFCDWDFRVWSAFLLPDQENIYITEPRVIYDIFCSKCPVWALINDTLIFDWNRLRGCVFSSWQPHTEWKISG